MPSDCALEVIDPFLHLGTMLSRAIPNSRREAANSGQGWDICKMEAFGAYQLPRALATVLRRRSKQRSGHVFSLPREFAGTGRSVHHTCDELEGLGNALVVGHVGRT